MLSVHLRLQNILITEMGAKCPKKTNSWVQLGCVINVYKQYHRPIIAYTE